jgi:general secretion pathway protein H
MDHQGTDPVPTRAGPPGRYGFTLIELLIVLAIAAFAVAITPPLIAQAMPGVELTGAARQLAAGLRYARSRAATHREESTLTLDVEARSFRLSGREQTQRLPERLHIELVAAAAETQGKQVGAIRFYPEGGSSGGRITLKHGERQTAVDVDWLTGRIRILED